MKTRQWVFCGIAAAMAIIALAATWNTTLFAFVGTHGAIFDARGWLDLAMEFLREPFNATATPLMRSLVRDFFCFAMLAMLWMIVEGKRLSVPYFLLYILGSLVVAISVFFPLFLIAREIVLSRRENDELTMRGTEKK